MSPAAPRPRDVAMASVLTIMGSALALAGIFGAQGQLRSSSVRHQIEDLLADQRFATINMSVDALLNVIEYGLMVAAAASVAAIVLAVFVMRGHNPSRIALTALGGLVAVLMLLSWPVGVVTAVFVAYTVSLLWRAPVRTWFAGAPSGGGAGDGGGDRADRSQAYWGMSATDSGGTGSGGGSDEGSGSGRGWPDDTGSGAGPGAGASGGTGSGGAGEPDPSRNPDAVPDPEPHWPGDPAQPGSGPAPYPEPWPPEPRQPGHHSGRPGQPGPQGQSGQEGQPGQEGPQQRGPWDPRYPGPHPSEQQGYGPPAYPSGGQGRPSAPGQGYPAAQGHPGGVGGYPGGGYPYASGYYGYPPATGDPYRRPAQVMVAHVLTWVGAAFGLVTGVFFVVAANSTDILDLVEQQLGASGISQGEFSAMLIAAGIVTALWSLAVVAISVFSWRGHSWAAVVLTLMGAGYLLVQLFTLLQGQIPVLFTIVWVAAVLALLWWPASRQWYAARRSGQHGQHGQHGQGPHGPQGPYGPSGPGSPYPPSPPPHRNQPW